MVVAENINYASEVRPWSDLQPELLELIIGHLTIRDRLCFDRVCKTWSSIVREAPRHNGLLYGLPCYVSISRDSKACTIVDPFCNKMHIKCPNLPSGCVVLSSKSGWLLLSHPLNAEHNINSVFFLNPLTQARIDIPNISGRYTSWTFTFSTPPDSPDCMVIGMIGFIGDTVTIRVCKRGHNQWSQFNQVHQFPFTMSHVSPIFRNGKFYCVGDNGRMGVFDPHINNWTVLTNPRPLKYLSNPRELYVVESDGDLMMVYANELGNRVRIYKLDTSTTQWKYIDAIGDATLLVGHMGSICLSVDALVRNGVYFPRFKDGICMFYSCKEHKFQPVGNFIGSRLIYRSFWTDLVWFKPSSQEQLKWS